MLTVADHPLLDVRVLRTRFPQVLGESQTPDAHLKLLSPQTSMGVALQSNDDVRKAVRNLLRHGGFKPTGRNKPAAEYLIKAVDQELLSPINLAVDVCNVVSLHSGLPISVVDAAKLTDPLHIALATADDEYVFNATGQILKLDGLLCLFDANGPCANAVKDSQRTKTSETTVETISVIWGTRELSGRTEQALQWYEQLLAESGAECSPLPLC